MKRAILLLAFTVSVLVSGQTVQGTQKVSGFNAPDATIMPLKLDFSYYAKNYNKVFGEFNFTRDANNFGARNVYVGYNGAMYYHGNSTYITEIPSNWPTYNFAGYQDVIGGLKNLTSLFNAEKDYSVKQP
ncbi:hypothetical protein ACX0HA_03080 [Flavobacterium hauense]